MAILDKFRWLHAHYPGITLEGMIDEMRRMHDKLHSCRGTGRPHVRGEDPQHCRECHEFRAADETGGGE